MDATASVMEDKDLFIPKGEYIGCWLHDDENRQVISNHGIPLVLPIIPRPKGKCFEGL